MKVKWALSVVLVLLASLVLVGPSQSAEPRLWYKFTFEGSGNRLLLFFGPFGPSDNPLQYERALDSMRGLSTPIGRLAPVTAMLMLNIPLPPSGGQQTMSSPWWFISLVEGTQNRPGGWLYVFIGPLRSGDECSSVIGKMRSFSMPVGRLALASCERLAFDY